VIVDVSLTFSLTFFVDVIGVGDVNVVGDAVVFEKTST
jgi:hypothetical protein